MKKMNSTVSGTLTSKILPDSKEKSKGILWYIRHNVWTSGTEKCRCKEIYTQEEVENNQCNDCHRWILNKEETEDAEHSIVQPGDPDWLDEYSRSDADPGL